MLGPVHPKLIEIAPAVAFGIIIVTKNGLTRLAPRSRNVLSLISIDSRPPTPVAAITAQRLGSAPRSPASASASAAAANPSWVTRSWRRTSFGPKYGVASKSFTSHAIWTGSSDASHRVIRPAVARPAHTVSHIVAASVPAGVFTPMPVTATRGRPRPSRKERSVMSWRRPWR